MALNYSQRPIFPLHTSEDNMVSPLRIPNMYVMEGITEKGGESFINPRHNNGDIHDRFHYGRDKVSQDPVYSDVIDLLPSDPFGMGIDMSTTFNAISEWHRITNTNEDYGLYAGLNYKYFWSNALRFQSFSYNQPPDYKGGEYLIHSSSCSESCSEALMRFNHGSTSTSVTKSEDLNNGGEPHDALSFALAYLGTKDLLSVERVCKSLCDTVNDDPLLWMNIHIDHPLNEKITDDTLVKLTSRAQGNLRCLTLVKCSKITDDGLKRVLQTNPKLTKLSIPGCTRLTIDGILNNLRAFKSTKANSGIKQLRTGGYYSTTHEHFKELKFLFGNDSQKNTPSYYHHKNSYVISDDDDRDLDIDICPNCQNVRLVYDCPTASCQVKAVDQCVDLCRACMHCIPRCDKCGKCVNNSEYEETFALEYLCVGCSKENPMWRKAEQVKVDVFVHG